MSELLELQVEFARHVGALLVYAGENYDGVTLGEAYRSNEQAVIHALGPAGRRELIEYLSEEHGTWWDLIRALVDNVGSGIRRSQHNVRLAIDLQLFEYQIEGKRTVGAQAGTLVYLKASAPYAELGTWWKARHKLARWGGDFAKPDGGHFSFEYKGVK